MEDVNVRFRKILSVGDHVTVIEYMNGGHGAGQSKEGIVTKITKTTIAIDFNSGRSQRRFMIKTGNEIGGGWHLGVVSKEAIELATKKMQILCGREMIVLNAKWHAEELKPEDVLKFRYAVEDLFKQITKDYKK